MGTGSSAVGHVLARDAEHSIEIKKSTFLTTLFTATDEPEVADRLARIRKQHFKARHHCSAMILDLEGNRQRSSDDGEPAGTAGAPMLQVLRYRGMRSTVAVVSRYFGGIKLGAGGLVRAYSQAVSQALDDAPLLDLIPVERLTVRVEPEHSGRAENTIRALLPQNRGRLHEVRYEPDSVDLVIDVPEGGQEALRADLVAGGVAGRVLDDVIRLTLAL